MPMLKTPADLGNIIREGRKQRGLDQTTLAQEIGVSRKWVIDIEKGKPRAELALVLRTLNALGISLNARQTDGTNATQPNTSIDDIIEGYRQPVDLSEAITQTALGPIRIGHGTGKRPSPFEAVRELAKAFYDTSAAPAKTKALPRKSSSKRTAAKSPYNGKKKT